MSLSLALLRRAKVGLALLVGPLHGAVVVVVVVVVVVSGHSSGHLGFGTQTLKLPSLLTVVLKKPVTLQDLLALVVLAVLAVLARVAVLGQRVEGQLRLAWLDILLQQLIDGQ